MSHMSQGYQKGLYYHNLYYHKWSLSAAVIFYAAKSCWDIVLNSVRHINIKTYPIL